MSDEQLKYLKSFNGKIIAMKSFFMTNLELEKALSYTSEFSSSGEYKRILFIIEANPQIANVKPFAKIGSIGYNNDQNDVLFMIGSLFKIAEIEDEKDGIINVKMTLCANDDTNTSKQLCDRLKYQYMDENGETDVIGFGQFLLDIGNSICDSNLLSSGEKLIHSCLGKLPNDHLDHSRCYDALGNIALIKEDLDSSLNWYKKSFDMKKGKLEITDPNLAESYKNLASVYLEKRDLIEALECFKQLSIIWKQSYGDDCFNLAFCYTNMAMIYESEGRSTDAISYYYQALAVMVKYPSVNPASFATLYNNLGNMYTELQNYHLALGFYNTSLEIKLKIHTPIHPSIATTYKNIGLVHGYMNNIQLSRENLEHAATIYREVHPADHINVTEIEELIANLPKNDQN
jgi:tetratricopeptide (TPR) repeat protein